MKPLLQNEDHIGHNLCLLNDAMHQFPPKSSNLNISYAAYVDQCYVSRSV